MPPLPSRESSFPHEPIYDGIHEDPLGCAPMSLVQTMAQDNLTTHRLISTAQASMSGRCEAILTG